MTTPDSGIRWTPPKRGTYALDPPLSESAGRQVRLRLHYNRSKVCGYPVYVIKDRGSGRVIGETPFAGLTNVTGFWYAKPPTDGKRRVCAEIYGTLLPSFDVKSMLKSERGFDRITYDHRSHIHAFVYDLARDTPVELDFRAVGAKGKWVPYYEIQAVSDGVWIRRDHRSKAEDYRVNGRR